VTTYTIYLSYL